MLMLSLKRKPWHLPLARVSAPEGPSSHNNGATSEEGRAMVAAAEQEVMVQEELVVKAALVELDVEATFTYTT